MWSEVKFPQGAQQFRFATTTNSKDELRYQGELYIYNT